MLYVMINIFYINKQEKSIDKFKILENSDKSHNFSKYISNMRRKFTISDMYFGNYLCLISKKYCQTHLYWKKEYNYYWVITVTSTDHPHFGHQLYTDMNTPV